MESKGKGKGNRKGKGRWKEDSLRNVGRTHGHKGDFTLSNAMHCIEQTISYTNSSIYIL